MSGPLVGRVALVTGAARGIGRAIAQRLADEGAAVCITDGDGDVAAATARELGGAAISVQGSVADVAHCEEAARRAADELGGLHILVNNAGLTRDAMVHRMTDDQWNVVQDVVLRGTFNMIRAIAPYFRDKERTVGRRIVSISSVSGIHGSVGNANYAAAKAGVIAITKSISQEWARFGVTVNAVAPGYVETRLTAVRDTPDQPYGIPGDIREALLKKIPVGRGGTPEDVAHAVSFFCSPLSDYITGQTLEVHGGMSDIAVTG
ncbi:MAG: 3-Oxoacyl (acyl-carrier protein) reductase [Solirubrobacterales bacterium]|nr:3-Oxoacyl (acyl-carrier protein) reductase [Solirubrobacterales bacterium]